MRGPLEEALRLHQAGDHARALLAYRLLLSREPGQALGWACYGGLLLALGRWEEARLACEKALELEPGHDIAQVHLAQTLECLEDWQGAEDRWRTMLTLDPESVRAAEGLSSLLLRRGRIEDGLACLDRAVADHPSNVSLLVDRMAARLCNLRLSGALQDLQALEGLAPDHPRYRWNRAIYHLITGNWEEGLPAYEFRWELPGLKESASRMNTPLWRGEPLEGKRLLLCAEQGLGDTLNYLRYAALAKERGARVEAQVQACLVALARTVEGLDQVHAWDAASHPPHDYYLSLVSAPMAFGTRPDHVPGSVPYVSVPPVVPNRSSLDVRMDRSRGLRVGLVWAGGREHARDVERSLDPLLLSPLLDIPGVQWFSLQKGREPLADPRVIDLEEHLVTWEDTAHALSRLDAMVCVDTAVAHLAGAMGVPTLLLINYFPDWRWLLDRDDTPWYPGMTLYRQPAPGEWSSVVQRVAGDLRKRC